MPADPLRISATAAAGLLVVELEGEADIESVPVLQAGLDEVVDELTDEVVIDLGRVSFLSPPALSVPGRSDEPSGAADAGVTGGPLRLATDRYR